MLDWRTLFEDATPRTLGAGETLFRRGDPVAFCYMVQSGTVALERGTPTGDPLVLVRAGPGALLAEASLFADRYHCDAVATTGAGLLSLDRTLLMRRLGETAPAALGLLSETAREVQRLRARIEILQLRRVSDRLDAWFDLNGAPASGRWVDVAEAIGVTPEALYRELARRRRGGPSGSLALPGDFL